MRPDDGTIDEATAVAVGAFETDIRQAENRPPKRRLRHPLDSQPPCQHRYPTLSVANGH
jgi:hypothetical protein